MPKLLFTSINKIVKANKSKSKTCIEKGKLTKLFSFEETKEFLLMKLLQVI